MDGYDDAILGFANVWHPDGSIVRRVIYSADRLVLRMVHDGMSIPEAHEFIAFNQEGAYVGPATPIIVWTATRDEIDLADDDA